MNEDTQRKSGIFDVLSGNESIKFDLGVDIWSISLIFGAVILAGLILIYANKKIR